MSYYSRIDMEIKADNLREIIAKILKDKNYAEAHQYEEIPYYELFVGNDSMLEYLDELEYEAKHIRKNASKVIFKLYDECNHFDFFMKRDWLREFKKYSQEMPNATFVIHQKNEEEEYYEWEIKNGKAAKRQMVVVLKGKEWEEV